MIDKFRSVAEPNIILRVEVGSTVHGVSLENTDDVDHLAVCVEPPHYVVGLGHFETAEYRDAVERRKAELALHPELAETIHKDGKHPKSQPGDLDLVVHSLRKWCGLALRGNPTVLLLLFSPKIIKTTPLGDELRRNAPAFASKRAGRAFLGYLHNQRRRMTGDRGGKDVNRPELVAAYGFDTKYAYHMLRLGYQGIEYMLTGQLELPMVEHIRRHLLDVRGGKYTLEQVNAEGADLEKQLESLLVTSGLPDHPATMVVDQFIMDTYQEYWGWYPDASVRTMVK